MEILGIKVLELNITDPFGEKIRLMILDREEYDWSVKEFQDEVQDFLIDNNKFKRR